MEKIETLLKITNLTKRFGGLVAVDKLSMDLGGNGIHSLIGPNGSGKTTTINLITGVLLADEGSLLFDGIELIGKKPHTIARTGIRRTYQNIKLFTSMTIKENIMIGGHSDTKAGMIRTVLDSHTFHKEEKALSDKADQILELIGFLNIRNKMSGSQPYGVQKVIELGIAMMTNPQMILLDEPAAGLNPSERAVFMDMVLKVKNLGIKFMMVEHNMDVVMNISEKITVLNFGQKIAEGTPYEIQNNDEVIRAYLGRKFKKPEA